MRRDGGYASRKFWFAVGTAVLIFLGGILSGVWQLFGPHYETMISGLCGVLGLYLGGNVAATHVTLKHLAGKQLPEQSPDPEESPKPTHGDPGAKQPKS